LTSKTQHLNLLRFIRFLPPLHVLPSTKCARSVAEISGLAVTSTPPTASSEAPVLFPSATLQLLDQFGKPWMREHAPEPPAPLHFDLSGGRGDPEGDKDATRGGAPGYMPRVIVSARVDTMSSIAMSKSVGPVSLGGITRATADEYGRVKFGELSLLTDAGGIHSVVFTAVIVEAKPNSGRGHRGDDDDNAKTNGGGGIFRANILARFVAQPAAFRSTFAAREPVHCDALYGKIQSPRPEMARRPPAQNSESGGAIGFQEVAILGRKWLFSAIACQVRGGRGAGEREMVYCVCVFVVVVMGGI
jgi:hypothetical protein